MSKRKTINIDNFVAWGNERLAQSHFQDRDSTEGVGYRKGIMTAIEEMLFASNRYAGFRYILREHAEVENGWGYDQNLKLVNDETRRFYFAKAA